MILPAPAAALGVEDEWSQLDSCSELLAQHLELAVRRWGQRALSVVDLPPISDVAPSAAELRVAAVLFWAREVESTGLLDFTEALAEGVIRGTLIVQLQVAGHRLGRYYRERQTRLARQERQLLYGRLSGGAGGSHDNVPFEGHFTALVETLAEIGRAGTQANPRHLELRALGIARELAGQLAARATGIAGFAARDIVTHIRESLGILAEPEIRTALGGLDPWSLIELHAPDVIGRRVQPREHLVRATNGYHVLRWLADHATQLSGRLRIPAHSPLVRAALAWSTLPRGDSP